MMTTVVKEPGIHAVDCCLRTEYCWLTVTEESIARFVVVEQMWSEQRTTCDVLFIIGPVIDRKMKYSSSDKLICHRSELDLHFR